MSSNLKYAVNLKNSRLATITSAIGATGYLIIFTGSQPANPDAATGTVTVLASLPCSATFAAAPSGGVLTVPANGITAATAAATGTATWGTLATSIGYATRIVDFAVATTGADLNLNTTSIVSGASVSVTSLTITSGN